MADTPPLAVNDVACTVPNTASPAVTEPDAVSEVAVRVPVCRVVAETVPVAERDVASIEPATLILPPTVRVPDTLTAPASRVLAVSCPVCIVAALNPTLTVTEPALISGDAMEVDVRLPALTDTALRPEAVILPVVSSDATVIAPASIVSADSAPADRTVADRDDTVTALAVTVPKSATEADSAVTDNDSATTGPALSEPAVSAPALTAAADRTPLAVTSPKDAVDAVKEAVFTISADKVPDSVRVAVETDAAVNPFADKEPTQREQYNS